MKKYSARFLALMLAVCFIVGLSACSGVSDTPETAVTIGGAEIGSDIYAYYLDKVLQDSDDSLSEEEAMKQAETLCSNYVKINTEFNSRNLILPSSVKAAFANEVNNLWSMYGGYYKKIGISKQTLTKVLESEAYKEDLITSMYGAGGEKEVSEEEQKEFFASNHIFFKAISAYLYTANDAGELQKLSAENLESLKKTFDDMKSSITGDVTIDSVNKKYEESNGGTAQDQMPILSMTKGSGLYPDEFFETVSKMETDELQVLTYDSYYFLIQKLDANEYYGDYATDNLKEMVSEEFLTDIESQYKDLSVSSDEGVQKACYKLIHKVKEK